MPKCIILVGPPGSGKSTFAKELVQIHDAIYINQDSQGKEEHKRIFDYALKFNQNVIVDRMNFSKEQRERYLVPAKAAGYDTSIHIIHESFDVCVERMKLRTDHETIKDEATARKVLHFFFTKYERVEDSEANIVVRHWPGGSKPDAVWIDMDNTLSNADHREHYLQNGKKNWKAFFEEMIEDPVNIWCDKLVRSSHLAGTKVLICSGRPDDYERHTREWLTKYDIPFDRLIMRRRNDNRKDLIVKEIMLEYEVKTKYNLLYAVDDRKQVIDQIRKHGVIVLDCAGEKGHF